MHELKITKIGNSLGIILTKDILEKLRVEKGDSLFVLESKNGIELTPYNPCVAEQLDIAEKVMRQDRDLLRKLANDGQ